MEQHRGQHREQHRGQHTAQQYGQFKATIIESTGKSLAPLDMLIATHAHSIGAVLISQDRIS